jgi:hypothetical protein
MFNIVSIYTTQRGFGIIFRDTDPLLLYGGSWIIAIGLSLFLLFFTFKLTAADLRHSSVVAYVAAYILVGSTSVFFNLNAIYASMASGDLGRARFYQERRELEELASLAESALRQKIQTIDEDVAKAKTAMDFEKTRRDRPGEGHRWLRRQEEYGQVSARALVQRNPLDQHLVRISEVIQNVRSLEEPSDYLQAATISAEFRSVAAELAALLSTYAGSVPQGLSVLTAPPPSPDNPAYTLETVWTSIRDAVRGGGTSHSLFRFALALLLSIVIDFLVFLAVLLSRPENLLGWNRRSRRVPAWRR